MLSKTLGLFLRADTRRPRLFLALAAVVILSTLSGAVPAAAQNRSLPLYAIDEAAPTLRTIDPLTGETLTEVTITATGATIDAGQALAVHPTTGVLYASLDVDGFDHRELASINPADGVATLLGEFLDGTDSVGIRDLTFLDDGTLYGISESNDPKPNTLFTINLTTAEATEVADLTVTADPTDHDGNAIAFNPEDSLIYHIFFDDFAATEFMQTFDPASPATAPVPVTVTGDSYVGSRGFEFFGNGMFLLMDGADDVFIVKATGEVRFLSTTADPGQRGPAFAGAPPACPPFQRLYGAANLESNGPSLFYAIDDASGAATLIGPIGFERVSAVAFDTAGVLWGGGELQDGTNQDAIFTIDPCTGLGTFVSNSNVTGVFSDLSFQPVTGTLFGFNQGDDDLMTVDTGTGAATFVGDVTGQSGNSIAFADETTLFYSDRTNLLTLDPADATVDATVPLVFPTVDALSVPPRHGALDFVDGVLTGALANGSSDFGDLENFLSTIDTTLGDVAIVGPTQTGLDAIASAAGFAELLIEKFALNSATGEEAGSFAVGDVVLYLIVVTNLGPADATNVEVKDTLPADITVDDFDPPTVDDVDPGDPFCDDSSLPVLTCTIPEIAAGDSVEIAITATVDVAATFTNFAEITFVDLGPNGEEDPGLAPNDASVEIDTGTYTVSISPASGSGGTSTYTVTVTTTDGIISDPVILECVVLTGNLVISCAFNPATITPGTTSGTSTLTVTAVKILSAQAVPPGSGPSAPLFAAWLGLPVLAFFGTLVFSGRRKQLAFALAVGLLVLAMLPLAGCNNGDEVVPVPSVGTFQVRGVLNTAVVNSSTVTVTVD